MSRTRPLALSREEFRAAGHRLVDQLADLLDGVPRRPVTPGERPSAVRSALGLGWPLPESGRDAGSLLSETAELLFDHSLFNGHPRFWGYITSSPAPIGMFADLLAAAVNPNVGGWTLMPAPASCAFGSVDATLPHGHVDHRHATGVSNSRQPALSAPENTSSEAAAMSGARMRSTS